MEWCVHYASDGADRVEQAETPEEAIALACRLLDSGADVFGIGMDEPPVSIGRDEIARIYEIWVRAGGTPLQSSRHRTAAGRIPGTYDPRSARPAA